MTDFSANFDECLTYHQQKSQAKCENQQADQHQKHISEQIGLLECEGVSKNHAGDYEQKQLDDRAQYIATRDE